MAGIDKTYTKNYKDYCKLKEWARGKIYTCPENKIKIKPEDYIYDWWKEDDFGKSEIPVMNTSNSLDYFLIKNCPLDFVQIRMKEVYHDEYSLIKSGRSEYDLFSKDPNIVGKHFKILRYPDVRKYKYPLGDYYWWIEMIGPRDIDLWYNEDYNIWLWEPYELGEFTSSVCYGKFKTIKAVMRQLRKWKLPIGTEVNIRSRYEGENYIVKIIR